MTVSWRSDSNLDGIRPFPLPGLWCVLGYYTACHYAPNGSGRILIAAAYLNRWIGTVIILSPDGEILDRFGEYPITPSFFHSGFQQTWSYDSRCVYYQIFENGLIDRPRLIRRVLETGEEKAIEGEVENMPPPGAPILSGLHSLLFQAERMVTCGEEQEGRFEEANSIQNRDQHGLFEYNFDGPNCVLRLSVEEILDSHPKRDEIIKADMETKRKLNDSRGLTLMLYAVRWNRAGTRCLFYFGNHNMDRVRGEPRIGYVFSADQDLKEVHLAVDLSFGRPGNHWSWHPDGEHMVGNGPQPSDETKPCLAQVRFDGSDYKKLSQYPVIGGLSGVSVVDQLDTGGGHPSVSPSDPNLLVTDTYGHPGEVAFIDLTKDHVIRHHVLPRIRQQRPGRHPYRIDHHPSFRKDGRKVLVNTLPGQDAVVCEIEVPL